MITITSMMISRTTEGIFGAITHLGVLLLELIIGILIGGIGHVVRRGIGITADLIIGHITTVGITIIGIAPTIGAVLREDGTTTMEQNTEILIRD